MCVCVCVRGTIAEVGSDYMMNTMKKVGSDYMMNTSQ